MQLIRIVALLMVLAAPAYSQEGTIRGAPLRQTPNWVPKALSDKLLEEIDAAIKLRVQLLEAQNKIQELEAKVKELTPPEPDKKPADAQGTAE